MLAEAVGEEGLRILVATRGGARLRVPTARRPNRRLELDLGPDLYAALVRTLSGIALDVPLLVACDRGRGRARDARGRQLGAAEVDPAAVIAARAAGLTADQIAPRYRLTRVQVYRILARHRDDTPAQPHHRRSRSA